MEAAVGHPAYVTTAVADLTGAPARSFRDWVVAHAPAYWRETFEKGETRQALYANVLRRVVLGLPRGASHRPPGLPRQTAAVCDG